MTNHELTIQRLTDLSETTDNKDVKLLSKIMREFVEEERKTDLGFKTEIEKVKPKE